MFTRKAMKRRLGQIEHQLRRMPVRQDLLDEAYGEFCDWGELHDEPRLAEAVVRRALGMESAGRPRSEVEVLVLAINAPRQPHPVQESVRKHLFYEAVYGDEIVRDAARTAIRVEVSRGGNVTDPEFAARHGLPEHASVGLHVLGYPERLATRPYVAQAHRLFDRFRDLRQRVPHDDAEWFAELAEAVCQFQLSGDLPAEDLMLDAVLADAEFLALLRHHAGQDVGELMAAFDRAARKTGAAQEAAIADVQRLVLARRAGLAGGTP